MEEFGSESEANDEQEMEGVESESRKSDESIGLDDAASDTRPAMIRNPPYASPLPLLLWWIVEAGQELWRRKASRIQVEAPALRMGRLKVFLEYCGQAIFSDRSDTADSMIIMHQVASILPEVIHAISNGTIPSEKMPRTEMDFVDGFKCKYLDIRLTAPRPMEDKLIQLLKIPDDSYESPDVRKVMDLLHEAMVSLDDLDNLMNLLSDVSPYHVRDDLNRVRVECADLMLVFEVFNQRQAACKILRRR